MLQVVPGSDEEEIDDDEPMDIVENDGNKFSDKQNIVRSRDLFRDKNYTSSGGSITPSSTSTSSSTSPVPEPTTAPATPHIHSGDYNHPSKISSHDLTGSFSWLSLLKDESFSAAPVSTFLHAPLAECWQNVVIGMKVEAENTDVALFNTNYWVASIIKVQGYFALFRYEGFGEDSSKDFWMNICSDKVHPVGWCATKGESLIPPKTIQSKYSDWKEFLVERLTGARTFPTNFHSKIWEGVSSLFRPGMRLEVIDKKRIGQVKVAQVVDVTGRRLHLSYVGDSKDQDDFWCHQESPLIKPVGWAGRVGHQIEASQEYHDRLSMETDCTPHMFPEYSQPSGSFMAGMKLEAVDPVSLNNICVASVMKVLRLGYIMIRIDGYETDPPGEDWFCYHSSSPLIFPPGFCQQNNIQLKIPPSHEGKFSWVDYLQASQSLAAPLELFNHKDLNSQHSFQEGARVECTDLMEPKLVCAATVGRVVGRLIKIHFDGWEDEYDQWMDSQCVDIYPVGWAEVVGHRLEKPPEDAQPEPVKKKKQGKNGKKKKGGKGNTGNKRRLTV